MLDTPPTADVTIAVIPSDLTEGTVSTSSLTFTPANWNVKQTITILGVDDALFDGNIAYAIVLAAAVSADSKYNGLNPADVSVVNLDNDVLPTKFYVVDDATQNLTYEYSANGGLVESYNLDSGNTSPRGAVSTVAGDKTWVVDANRKVYVYNNSGGLLGSWTAGTLATNATVEGIATNGTDVWIVDNKADRVYRYSNAAGLTTGSLNAVSSFALNSSNTNPKDIVTDGTSLWVVNDSTTDKVFKYTLSGSLVGSSWTIDSANKSPTGITLDPSGASQSLWIVDNGTDRVYEYTNARSKSSGSQAANVTFALAAGNTNPQGIADPPPSVSRLTYAESLPISTAVSPNLQTMAPMQSLENSGGSNPNASPRAAFGSEVEALQTPYPSPRRHSTSDVSGLALADSLPIVSKASFNLKASYHDSVLSNELFDGLDTSLIESLVSAR